MTEPTTVSFHATLERPAEPGTWTYLRIPADLKATFGIAGQIKVRGTIDGEPFQSSAMPRGDGSHYLVVNGTIRDRIGASVGNQVAVALERDFATRTVAVPADLANALDAGDGARAAFDGLSYSHRKEYVEWIESAKTDATRAKRVLAALEMIPTGGSPKKPKRG